jgi:hypothetical protein
MAGASVKTKVSFERIKKLQEKLTRGEINGALDDVLKEVSDMWVEDAHVVTGFMQSRIEWRTSAGSTGGRGGGYHGSVFCTADYAIHEVNRGGIHDFTTRGITTGQRLLSDRIRELIHGN